MDATTGPNRPTGRGPDPDRSVVMLRQGSVRERLAVFRAAEPGPELADLIDVYLQASRSETSVLARRLRQRFGLDEGWTPRFEQIVCETIAQLLTEVAEGRLRPRPHSWPRLVLARGVRTTRAYLDESRALRPASGMGGWVRRQRLLRLSRDELRHQLGREPGKDELIAAANRRAAGVADASRASLRVTEADLAPSARVSLDVTAPGSEDAGYEHAEPVLWDHEWDAAVAASVDACAERSPQHGDLADWWLAELRADRTATARAAADAFGLAESTARRQLAEVRTIVRRVLVEDYGLQTPAAG